MKLLNRLETINEENCMCMKNSHKTTFKSPGLLAALLSLLVALVLALPVNVNAIEDPVGCTFPPGGAGNTSQGGINFNLAQAHVGDTVQVFPSLGMSQNACRAVGVTGVVFTASGPLTNFLVNVSLDPNSLISCPAGGPCKPGPYNVVITSALVGTGQTNALGQKLPVIYSPNRPEGFGTPAKTVVAVENGVGTVLTVAPAGEQLADFHTATISIVTPCVQAITTCAYVGTNTCFAANEPIKFTGYVTNCGDIRMTNVLVKVTTASAPNGVQLLSTIPPNLPLLLPFSLDPGQAVGYQGSYNPTLAEICAGSSAKTATVSGTDVSFIGGPNASVTNVSVSSCQICIAPCLKITRDCSPTIIGGSQTVSGVVSNCGNIAISGIVISDTAAGIIATNLTLAAGAAANYSTVFTAAACGSTSGTVTAIGTTACGAGITNTASSTCVVSENPCIGVTKSCDMALIGQPNLITIVLTNCGNVRIASINVSDSKYGTLATNLSILPGGSLTISNLVNNLTCGNNTSVVTVNGSSTCGTPVSASATNTCYVDCPPCITVTKTVACLLPGTNCGPFGKIATGMKGDSQSPAFCYSITVSNCGSITLTNVIVNDNQLGVLANYPASLPVNGTATRFYTKAWAVDTTNTVTVSGQSQLTGGSVNSTDSAVALVVQASVTCNLSVSSADDTDPGPEVNLPSDGNAHQVIYTHIICAGNVALANVSLTDPVLAGLGCTMPQPFSIPAHGCVTNICSISVNCSNLVGGAVTNTIAVTATTDTSSGACGTDINGQPVSVSNSGPGTRPCAAVVRCTSIPNCSLTVEKTACIVKKPIEDCEEEPVCIKIKYCGEDRDHETRVKVTCESGESRTYKLGKLHKGDTIGCSEEHGFTFDASCHGKKKIGKTCRVEIDGESEVHNLECDDKDRDHRGLHIGRGLCLDSSSPNNRTGSKTMISSKWSLVAAVDPVKGLRTEDDSHRSDDKDGRGCDGKGGHDRNGDGHDDHDSDHCPNKTKHGCDGHGGHDNDGDGHDDHDDDHCQPPADVCNNVLPPVKVKDDSHDGGHEDCDGDVHSIHFGYEGGGCRNMHHSQSDKECKGETFSDKPFASPVRIRITDGAGGKVYLDTGAKASVKLNDIVTASAGYGAGNHFGSDTLISIYDDRGKLCSRVKFKTDDCKKLHLGDGFGGMKVCEMDSDHGGEKSLGVNVLYTYTIRNGDSNSCPVTGMSVVDDKLGTIATNLTILGGQTIVLTNLVLVSDPVTNIVVVSGISCGGICTTSATAAIVRAVAPTNKECSEEIEGFLVEYTGEDRPAGTTITFVGDTGASVKYSFPNGLAKGTILSKASESDPDKAWTVDCKKHGRDKLGTKTHVRCNDHEEEVLHTGCTCREHNFIPGEPACLDESSPDNHDHHKGAPSPMFKVVSFK